MSNPSLADVLLSNAFLSLTIDNKILCSITKHEMPPKLDIVLGHINGQKFKKTLEWYNYDYSEFEPYVVPDRQNPTKLHCKLTGQTLNKIPEEVKKHTNGKKFLRLKKENEELQKKQIRKERDTNPDIWVPSEELLEDDIDEEAEKATEKKGTKTKAKDQANGPSDEVEEDTFSDLLGSDHGDELDNDSDNESDFDEIENAEEVVKAPVQKKSSGKKIVAKKGAVEKSVASSTKGEENSKKSLKRPVNVIEESDAKPNKKTKKDGVETAEIKTVGELKKVKKDVKKPSRKSAATKS